MPVSPQATPTEMKPLTWETDIPVATHPVMLANFAMLFAATGAMCGALLAFILAMTGRAASIETVLEWTASATAGAYLFALLLATILLGNRLHMRFRLDAAGAQAETAESHAKLAARAVAAFSWLAERFGLAGAGLIAAQLYSK